MKHSLTLRRLNTEQREAIVAYLTETALLSTTPQGLRAAAHMRQAEFNLAFKGTFGTTPTLYLRGERMAHACRLLLQRHGVKAVAVAAGYRNVTSFGKSFKQVVGMPPGRWQRKALLERTDG